MSIEAPRPPEGAITPVIDAVQQNGDLLDRTPWLRHSEHLGFVAAIGASTAGIHIACNIDTLAAPDQPPAPVLLASGILFASGLIASRATQPIARRHHIKKGVPLREAMTALSEEFDGDSIEVYRQRKSKKAKRTHLVWEPHEDNADNFDRTVQVLTTLNEQIKNAPVDTVAVPEKTLESCAPNLFPTLSIIDRKGWINDIKRTPVTDVANKDNNLLTVFTKENFALLVERLNNKDQPQPLDIYMQLLKQQRAQHPSLRFYNEKSAAGPAKNRQRLIKSLTTHLNAKLTDTDVMEVPNDHGAPMSKEKVHKTGQVFLAGKHTPTIRWNLGNGRPSGDTDSLLRYVGITEKELEDLPEHIDRMPKHKAILACEIGAYLAAHKALRTPPRGIAQEYRGYLAKHGAANVTDHARGMQVRIADRTLLRKPPIDAREKTGISLKPIKARRMARALLPLAAAFSLGGAVGIGSEVYQRHYYEQNVSPFYDKYVEHQSDAASVEESEQSIDEVIAAEKKAISEAGLLFKGTAKISEGSYTFQEFISSQFQKLSSLQKLAPKEVSAVAQELFNERDRSLVGNSDRSKNKPVWFIQSFGDMNSKGYWTEATSHSIAEDEIEWFDYAPDYKELKRAKITTLPSPETSDATQPHLAVKRIISKEPRKDLGNGLSTSGGRAGFNYFDDYTIFNVPVLQNTDITAAVAGKNTPLKVVRLKNGQQVLLAPRKFETGKIEYWLSPSKSPDEKIHAVGPIQDTYEHWDAKDAEIKPITKPWQQVLPSSLSLRGLARVQAQADYIKSTFDYRIQPFKTRVPVSLDAYAKAVLKSKQANCNTANTLLAVSNPQTLSAVTGYRNTNTPEQVEANTMHLSSKESHLWTVDKKGTIHDATPGKGITDADAALFEENYQEPFTDPTAERRKKMATLLSILAVGGIAGAGYKSRRRVKRGIHRNLKRHATKQLITTPEAEKQLAHAAAEHILYSKDPLSSKELETIKQRLTNPPIFETQESAHTLWTSTQKMHTPKQFRRAVRANTIMDSKELFARLLGKPSKSTAGPVDQTYQHVQSRLFLNHQI